MIDVSVRFLIIAHFEFQTTIKNKNIKRMRILLHFCNESIVGCVCGIIVKSDITVATAGGKITEHAATKSPKRARAFALRCKRFAIFTYI